MFGKNKVLMDAAVGSALGLALLMVFAVDRLTARKPNSASTPGANSNTLQVREVGENENSKRKVEVITKKLRLGVTTHAWFRNQNILWDDMRGLLRGMGDGYKFDEITPETLPTIPVDRYDVLFLTCAPGDPPGIEKFLVSFVEQGGTLYASDIRFNAVAKAFPDKFAPNLAGYGVAQKVHANVVDPGLRDHIGPTIDLNFDLVSWRPAAFRGPDVTTLIQGRYQRQRFQKDNIGVPAEAPLLVKFKQGKGTVIFTSFHNEKQNSELETKLLQYLVFTLVQANIEDQMKESIQQAGFAPQKSNLLSTPRENPSVTRTYANSKQGPLRFSLGFRDAGARLRLAIKSPDGQTHTWEGTKTVTLEVSEALPGEWTYTVTAVTLPFENFPFTVTVSEKK